MMDRRLRNNAEHIVHSRLSTLPVSPFQAVITELESALQSGSPGRRTEVLRRITDLFTAGSQQLSDQQIGLFDDVLNCLVEHIETQALSELSTRLAPIAKAPPRVVRQLASNDAIEIAGPILTNSERLSDEDLIEIVRTKGHGHQLRIAGRSHLNEAVTEVLIDRGNSDVVNTVAGNEGARFSDVGFTKLVVLASGDDRLAETVAGRADVPPRLFRDLLEHASETVRQRLLTAASAENRERLKKILNDISGQLGSGLTAKHYAEAQQLVAAFARDTATLKAKLLDFAVGRRLDEVVAILTALSAVRIELVDRLFYSGEVFGMMVLCKLTSLDWNTAFAVLMARPNKKDAAPGDMQQLEEDYRALSPQMAQRMLRFWQSRQDQPGQASVQQRRVG